MRETEVLTPVEGNAQLMAEKLLEHYPKMNHAAVITRDLLFVLIQTPCLENYGIEQRHLQLLVAMIEAFEDYEGAELA